ncbi:MAG: septum formation inhibitor Maf [Magnetococcales bacterium]|nr:septum formation inhibitor Maf [Magnetococcales bacterium]MBF0148590.1 septum formation inhibitor Maf [Magnetococcales bacterium]MBF0172280.1 septum formation inhibitor Maf [Magnetococcales bacterium]MBF0347319.1 septum formation inhibitor Maf [Magnetococcales bacterium]MBF0629717.1 septum formation inhibitor Maf [Magnetococcales bacterium]
MKQTRIVLASTSVYRRTLLARLGLDFDVIRPDVIEDPLPDEDPRDLVLRLAEAKARSVGRDHPDAIIIGSDQVAVLDRRIIGKPGTIDHALTQLRRASGRTVLFLTGVCCLRWPDECQVDVVTAEVTFRPLDEGRIRRYVARDMPLDCAGSFKSEGLGITLFERITGDDPTALMGLPLIRLSRMLEHVGIVF